MLGKGSRISCSLFPKWSSLRKTSEGILQCEKEAVDFVDTGAGGARKAISVPWMLFLTGSGIWPIKEAFVFSGNIFLLTKWLHTPVLQIESSTRRVRTCSFQHVLAKGYLRWNSLFCWSAEEKANVICRDRQGMIFVLMKCRTGLSFHWAGETIHSVVSVHYWSTTWSASRLKPPKGSYYAVSFKQPRQKTMWGSFPRRYSESNRVRLVPFTNSFEK